MKAEELKKGKDLADESLKWHRSTMPFPDEYMEEPIPKLVKWLKQFAFPELELSDQSILKHYEQTVVRSRKKLKGINDTVISDPEHPDIAVTPGRPLRARKK